MSRVTITLPHLGEDVSEATISRWLVSPGDVVDADAPLLEVATDKVDTEVPTTQAGRMVERLVEEDDVVEIGAPVAVIEVLEVPKPPLAPVVVEPAQVDLSPEFDAARVERLPRIRQVIARRMMDSLHNSAQLTTVLEADVTAVTRLRAAVKTQFHERVGVKLSYLPFFAKATVEALIAHPVLSATLNAEQTEITYHNGVHLGIAVDAPKGLMVPVIRDAHTMSIAELALAISDLAAHARAGTISPDSLVGGTFTITNTGSRGALFDTPILNQPQSGILGTGAVVERVIPQRDANGEVGFGVRSMAYLSITYDHRVVDGADAARFLGTAKARLERGFTADEVVGAGT